MVRKNDKPLEQIINRVSEANFVRTQLYSEPNEILGQEHLEGALLPNC